MGCKATDTTCNINCILCPGTVNEHAVQCWLEKFSKGDNSLESEEHCERSSEINNGQLKEIIEADPLTTTGDAEEFSVAHSMAVWHLKWSGKVKKFDKWVPHELTANQKTHCFSVSSSIILYNNNEPFLYWIEMCDQKWILYKNKQRQAQWLNWKEDPKHFPKSNFYQKEVMVTVVVCCQSDYYSFLNSSETIVSLWSMLSK